MRVAARGRGDYSVGGHLIHIFDLFVSWPAVIERMAALADDEKNLESLVADQLEALVRKEHPDDYSEFVSKHAGELERIKRNLSRRYSKELKKAVDALRTHSSEKAL